MNMWPPWAIKQNSASKKKSLATSQATMAHASNSSYSGGRDQIRRMVVQSTQFIRPYLKKEKQKTQHKIGLQSGSNDREPAWQT
jgi:hypothetical protein